MSSSISAGSVSDTAKDFKGSENERNNLRRFIQSNRKNDKPKPRDDFYLNSIAANSGVPSTFENPYSSKAQPQDLPQQKALADNSKLGQQLGYALGDAMMAGAILAVASGALIDVPLLMEEAGAVFGDVMTDLDMMDIPPELEEVA